MQVPYKLETGDIVSHIHPGSTRLRGVVVGTHRAHNYAEGDAIIHVAWDQWREDPAKPTDRAWYRERNLHLIQRDDPREPSEIRCCWHHCQGKPAGLRADPGMQRWAVVCADHIRPSVSGDATVFILVDFGNAFTVQVSGKANSGQS